jgi:hypothetical protein
MQRVAIWRRGFSVYLQWKLSKKLKRQCSVMPTFLEYEARIWLKYALN